MLKAKAFDGGNLHRQSRWFPKPKNKEVSIMFFGPFLPAVPILFLLEYLPESIGEPIQAAIIGIIYLVGSGFDGLLSLLF